ncbi:hypothetical protein KC345_g610 [Hortaea werneckii]|nr:hypothetical protein KC345_g610 [Hortaea werneckii]
MLALCTSRSSFLFPVPGVRPSHDCYASAIDGLPSRPRLRFIKILSLQSQPRKRADQGTNRETADLRPFP